MGKYRQIIKHCIMCFIILCLTLSGCSVRKDSIVSEEDFGEAYELCDSFMKDFLFTLHTQEEIDVRDYAVNPNFINYLNAIIAIKQNKYGSRIKSIEAQESSVSPLLMEDTNCIYVPIAYDVTFTYGGMTDDGAVFLVQKVNGQLVIADMYYNDSYYNDSFRENEEVTHNPNVWNCGSWVEDVFDKIKRFCIENDKNINLDELVFCGTSK